MCDNYDITYSDLNPTLFFAGKRALTHNGKLHSHDATEVLIVISGSMSVCYDEKLYSLNAGDIICIQPKIPHYSVVTDFDDPAIFFFTGFSDFHFKGMEPNCISFPGNSPVLHTDGLMRQDITNLCLRMIAERYSNQIGQYFMQKAYLTQLLLLIMRHIMTAPLPQTGSIAFETHHKSYVVTEIRRYLNDHYADKISLDLIAKNMYLSSAYISKIFKDETGEAPINYLIKLRLERARILLASEPDQSIKSISNSVGYEDVYYFSKLFKKYFGVAPTTYRWKCSKNV